MARLALRQFLRSSFDPGDKTMASPIIAWLGAATLLASSCFASITATSSNDYYDNDGKEESNYVRTSVRPLEPPPSVSSLGYVRRSSYSDASVYNNPPIEHSGIALRAFNEPDALPRDNVLPKTALSDYLGIMTKYALLIIDIAAKEMDKGIAKIAANVEIHEDGGINVPAETQMGKTMGIVAQNYLRQFFRDRWVGVLGHMAQEAADRFVAGSEHFFAKTNITKPF